MKSREGTVVDADDLMEQMVGTAQTISEELGKLDGFSDAELSKIYEMVGMGALKYYILKVDPKKRMMFNPEESIDFNGHTGPFIQYTHARICALQRRAESDQFSLMPTAGLEPKEKELLKVLLKYPEVVQEAAVAFSPAVIANYCYDLVKEYNQFYQQVPIFGAKEKQDQSFRIGVSVLVAKVIAKGMRLLGVHVPERM
jgi:arginyl-tRNA synthetase